MDDLAGLDAQVWYDRKPDLEKARSTMAGEGLKSGMVQVSPYNPLWADKFTEEAGRLQRAIGQMVADIQHIGSTAIPGMAAKPIIDIAVAVSDEGVVGSLVDPLTALGYEYRGLLLGIAGHHFFRKGDPREYFLHVFEHRSDLWERRIAFRDYLIRHADVAAEYRALKERLAFAYPDDRTSYTAEKKAFVESVTDIALKAQRVAPGDADKPHLGEET